MVLEANNIVEGRNGSRKEEHEGGMAVQRSRTWNDEFALTDTGNADRPRRNFRPRRQKGKPCGGIICCSAFFWLQLSRRVTDGSFVRKKHGIAILGKVRGIILKGRSFEFSRSWTKHEARHIFLTIREVEFRPDARRDYGNSRSAHDSHF